MNNVRNKNRKVLEETVVGSNSDAVKTTLTGLHYFKIILRLLQVLEKHFPIPLFTSSNLTENIRNGSVGSVG